MNSNIKVVGKREDGTLILGVGDLDHHEHFDHEAHGFPCSEGPTEAHQRVMSIARDWIADISLR